MPQAAGTKVTILDIDPDLIETELGVGFNRGGDVVERETFESGLLMGKRH